MLEARADRSLEDLVAHAQAGDRSALERVVEEIQQDVYGLALRFLWHPQDAEDATQEILVRIVTGLATFEARSRFRTWVYRVATNALITAKQRRGEQAAMSFDEFAADLENGLSDGALALPEGVEEAQMLEEVKIGCTHAMLLCLDRGHRLAYILGEIVELDHREGAEALEISPAAFRKRLSRARADLAAFMQGSCGLIDRGNACRCRKRVGTAIALGRVQPSRPLFATDLARARRFPRVLHEIRRLEAARRSAALYKSHPTAELEADFSRRLSELVSETPTTGS